MKTFYPSVGMTKREIVDAILYSFGGFSSGDWRKFEKHVEKRLTPKKCVQYMDLARLSVNDADNDSLNPEAGSTYVRYVWDFIECDLGISVDGLNDGKFILSTFSGKRILDKSEESLDILLCGGVK